MTRRVVASLVGVYLVLVFIDRFVLVELFVRRVGVPFLLACAVAMACIGTGLLARRGRGGVAMNLAIGYPIFGAICFLVGLLKISVWTMVPLVAIFAIAGVLSVAPAPSPATAAVGGGAPLLAIALVFICGFIAAQAPPSTLDELAYHLAVPWAWVKEGRAIDLPLISHSYFPLGVESADLPLLSILGTGGGVASHFLHLFVAAAAAALIFRGDALIVAAIVTAPALAVTAGWSLVDWNLLAVALALLRAAEEDDRTTLSAALAAGLLTKYTFIPIAAIVLIATVWRPASAGRGRLKPAHTLPAHTLWIGLVAGSIFFIRNLVLTGNPFAPFFSALAPHVTRYRDGASISGYVFDGHFLDESLGASLLSTSIATAGATCWLLAGAGALLFLLAPSARIVVPFFAVAASRASLSWRPLRFVVATAVVLQLFLLVYFVDRSGVFALMSARESDEQFLARARPSYETIRAVDAALPDHSRTLIVGMSETFWFRHRVRGGGNFDGPRVSAYLEAATAEVLRDRLRGDGITHVAVVSLPAATTVAKKAEERETALSPSAQRSLALLLDRYAASVTQHGGAALFALR